MDAHRSCGTLHLSSPVHGERPVSQLLARLFYVAKPRQTVFFFPMNRSSVSSQRKQQIPLSFTQIPPQQVLQVDVNPLHLFIKQKIVV